MKIRNWTKFQHYNHRRPPWIKIYRDLLDDPAFMMLSGDASKMLVMCWLLASENDGELPDVATIAFRTRQDLSTTNKLLSQLNQWFEHDASTALADCQQDATPESETESELELEKELLAPSKNTPAVKKRRGAHYCPDDWQPSRADLEWAIDKGFDGAYVNEVTEQMIDWSRGSGKKKADWSATWRNWLRREMKQGKVRQPARNRMEIIGELAENVDFGIGDESSEQVGSELPRHRAIAPPEPGRSLAADSFDPDGD